jgi:hypothetical protein
MKFIERFFQKEPESQISKLHKDFRIKEGSWQFNRSFSEVADRLINLKVRFAFDNPALLDNCTFHAKIGLNLDENLAQKYIGFAYGNDKIKNALMAWAKKFPYSELMENLDADGMPIAESNITVINNTEHRLSL